MDNRDLTYAIVTYTYDVAANKEDYHLYYVNNYSRIIRISKVLNSLPKEGFCHMDIIFRFAIYCLMGLTLEMVFSATLLDKVMGRDVHRRVPKKYLEGFVSLYMIPVHGFGMLLVFENVYTLIASFPWVLRYIFWAFGFVAAEAGYGILLKRIIGFYPWDYYADSKYKVMEGGYSLWTLLPFWGIYGILCEKLVVFLLGISIGVN